MNPTPAKMNTQKGLSLVELMVAVTIGLILLAGVIQIFTSNKQAYRVQSAMARVQENGRLAMQLLTQDIRMADFWGCNSTAGKVINNLKDDAAYLGADARDGGIFGTDASEGAPSATNRADTVTLQGAFGAGIPVISSTGTKFTVPVGNRLQQYDPIVVADCASADLVQITGATPDTTGEVVGAAGIGTPGNTTPVVKEYTKDAQIYVPRRIQYSIRDDATTGERGLYLSIDGTAAMMLVEGVEDMQILYGYDTSGDLVADQYVSAATLNIAATAADRFDQWAKVVTIRVELTVRSEDNIAAETTAMEDRRLRRNFASTIAIRNRVI